MATNGLVGSSEFSVESGGSIVIAFSMTGSFIPAGAGVLVELDIDNTAACLTSIVISGENGIALEDCVEEVCIDFCVFTVF